MIAVKNAQFELVNQLSLRAVNLNVEDENGISLLLHCLMDDKF